MRGLLFLTAGALVAGNALACSNSEGTNAYVGGGCGNTASGALSVVIGGQDNRAVDNNAAVGGGYQNTARAGYSTISGGNLNEISDRGDYASVGGGQLNTALKKHSAVGGGSGNAANGLWASIAGGVGNAAANDNSVILGGQSNQAIRDGAVAAGSFSLALHKRSAAFGFSGSSCTSMGTGTVNFCTANGFYVNGIDITAGGARRLSEEDDEVADFKQSVLESHQQLNENNLALQAKMDDNEAKLQEALTRKAELENRLEVLSNQAAAVIQRMESLKL